MSLGLRARIMKLLLVHRSHTELPATSCRGLSYISWGFNLATPTVPRTVKPSSQCPLRPLSISATSYGLFGFLTIISNPSHNTKRRRRRSISAMIWIMDLLFLPKAGMIGTSSGSNPILFTVSWASLRGRSLQTTPHGTGYDLSPNMGIPAEYIISAGIAKRDFPALLMPAKRWI